MAKQCCKTSVGVLVLSEDRTQMLMIRRGTAPAGIAPVAGHALDEHADYAAAAREEVAEEIGLTVTELTPLVPGGFHPGRCRRINSTGHTWELFEAAVTGELDACEREVAAVGWYPLGALQALAETTAAWASGRLTTEAFTADPGLEPVWCHWLTELGYITLPAGDLDVIEAVAATPPSQH
ncbi:NUDIX domain-containing protein [Nocardiopsis sp. NPDC006938]|uniref:NUDIX domain-containing protein n=1 Tax=Nocardiopsis sp. NPDC006938 TaxID=3364337 RepID=UPI0036CA0B1B